MWKQLLDLFTKIITLSQRTDKLEQIVKNQQQELKDLTAFVQRMAFELQRTNDEMKRTAEREATERKLLRLQIENQLLKAGRQLTPTPGGDDEENER